MMDEHKKRKNPDNDIRRKKRNAFPTEKHQLEIINTLSRRNNLTKQNDPLMRLLLKITHEISSFFSR